MKSRLLALSAAALIAGAVLAPVAQAASTTVVISQVVFRGPVGGNEERRGEREETRFHG